MTPKLWDMVSFDCGTLAIVASDERLLRLCFESSREQAAVAVRSLYPGAQRARRELVAAGLEQVTEFFSGARREFTLPLDEHSLSGFARRVHRELIKVPYGAVVSYGELAARAGSPQAARAVGGVMSTNPFPLLVPCHRVVNADGRLGHYSAGRGVASKAWLIEFESKRAKARQA